MRLQQFINEKEEFKIPHKSGKSKIKTFIAPEKRTFSNLPRDSKRKAKCRFQDWLEMTGNPGKAANGKWYGYSHRAITSYGIGDIVKGDNMGHKDYKWSDDDKGVKRESYIIKTDQEAKAHADRFRRMVS